VFNDINPFDESRIILADNARLVRNLVSFSGTGPRSSGTIVQIDCGRPVGHSRSSNFCPPSSVFETTITRAGYSFERIASSQGTLTSVKAGVKTLFLLFPCEAYTRDEVNALKLFASEGGRIIFLGEHQGFYGPCIPVQNQFLRDMGAQMTNTGQATDAGTLPPEFIRPHQITEGMTIGFEVAASSHIVPGPNDYPLILSREFPGAVLAGVARIDVTPLPPEFSVIGISPRPRLQPTSAIMFPAMLSLEAALRATSTPTHLPEL
jgi:hypothetical protein